LPFFLISLLVIVSWNDGNPGWVCAIAIARNQAAYYDGQSNRFNESGLNGTKPFESFAAHLAKLFVLQSVTKYVTPLLLTIYHLRGPARVDLLIAKHFAPRQGTLLSPCEAREKSHLYNKEEG
jgi:hypothetical protein